jgi:hypothetical protein
MTTVEAVYFTAFIISFALFAIYKTIAENRKERISDLEEELKKFEKEMYLKKIKQQHISSGLANGSGLIDFHA